VLFEGALIQLATETDYLIEVGPGGSLTRLARQAGDAAPSVDAFGGSIPPLPSVIRAPYLLRQNVDVSPPFDGRAIRPIDLATLPRFLVSPCGRRNGAAIAPVSLRTAEVSPVEQASPPIGASDDVLSIVRAAIAEETGFGLDNIRDGDRFLDDLHLNSIA